MSCNLPLGYQALIPPPGYKPQALPAKCQAQQQAHSFCQPFNSAPGTQSQTSISSSQRDECINSIAGHSFQGSTPENYVKTLSECQPTVFTSRLQPFVEFEGSHQGYLPKYNTGASQLTCQSQNSISLDQIPRPLSIFQDTDFYKLPQPVQKVTNQLFGDAEQIKPPLHSGIGLSNASHVSLIQKNEYKSSPGSSTYPSYNSEPCEHSFFPQCTNSSMPVHPPSNFQPPSHHPYSPMSVSLQQGHISSDSKQHPNFNISSKLSNYVRGSSVLQQSLTNEQHPSSVNYEKGKFYQANQHLPQVSSPVDQSILTVRLHKSESLHFPMNSELQSQLSSEYSENGNDDEFIEQFISKVKRSKSIEDHFPVSIKNLKLQELHIMIRDCVVLTKRLYKIAEQLASHLESVENSPWDTLKEEAEDIKSKIICIRSTLEDANLVPRVKFLIEQRRKKRQKCKRRKIKKGLENAEKKAKMRIKEEEINKWLDKLQKKEAQLSREKLLKKEVDEVLCEVRQKQMGATKMTELLDSMCKLRQVRINKGVTHGYISSPENDKRFNLIKDQLACLVDNHLKEYKLEEQTLRVMIEESGNTKYTQEIYANVANNTQAKQESLIRKVLFGAQRPADISLYKSFVAADTSLEILFQRRVEWDQFIVASDHPLGSSVPLGWVVPPEIPSDGWEGFQLV